MFQQLAIYRVASYNNKMKKNGKHKMYRKLNCLFYGNKISTLSFLTKLLFNQR